MPRDVLVQKGFALSIVAAALLLLTPFQMAVSFAVFGQGHFIASYYYQWRARKVTVSTIILFTLVATLACATALLFASFEVVAFVAGAVFFVHHFQDEPLLWGNERSPMRTLEQLPPIALYVALAADTLFDTHLFPFALIVVALIATLYLTHMTAGGYRPDALSAYFASITVVIATIRITLGPSIPPEYLFGAIILFHYACWYVHYFFKTKARGDAFAYIVDMLAVHGVVFAAFALFVTHGVGSAILHYIFAPLFFYVWALLHILSTVRASDYSVLFRRH